MVLEKNSSKQLDLQELEDFPFYDSMTSPAVRSPGLSDTPDVSGKGELRAQERAGSLHAGLFY